MQTHSSRAARRRVRFLLCGVLFEVLLIAIVWTFGPDPTAFVHLYNFAMLSHIPFFWIAEWFRLELVGGIFLLILWAVLWSVIFYFLTRGWSRFKERFLVTKRRRIIFATVSSLIVAFFVLSSSISSWPARATPFTSSPEIKIAVQNNTLFALDLFQKLKARPGNLFFSPYSISTSLAMTSAGARGRTETEMANALHLQLPPEKRHAAFGELARRMNQIERWNRITLKTANGLWAQTDHPFDANFLSNARNNYAGEIRQANFGNSANVLGEINDWIARQTNRKIRDAVSADQLSREVRLVLCNAIYFKGKWKTQFKPRDTKPRNFYLDSNETIQVPMMSQKGTFKTASNDEMNIEMLELPYSGKDLSMVILLPFRSFLTPGDAPVNLATLERDLTFENLQLWLEKLDRAMPQKIVVSLPRFKTSQSLAVLNELKSLGIVSAFNAQADFSGINGTKNLFISDVIQKTFVEVSETGTEASAVTVQLAKAKGMDHRFTVDHPFIFLIRENATGSILFLGRILDPRN